MFKKLLLCSSLLAIGGCASFVDKAVQEITFQTPGAHNASCDVYVAGLRYSVNPPETIGIYQSEQDLVVDCMAPGNRRQKIFVRPELSDSSAWNLATGGAGYVYDYATKALFKYPDTIVIDFTDAPIRGEALPAQNNPDIRQPEDYELEEFLPSQPQLNSDKNRVEMKILRRGESAFSSDSAGTYSAPFSEAPAQGKGDLMDAPVSSTGSRPVSLIPGQ